jgi:ArsR family transcriptional regulator
MCVCDLAALLGATQSAISHQLRVLRSANLVKYRKAGKVLYYSLSDDHVQKIINEGMEHVVE